jgi:hypothetical protein
MKSADDKVKVLINEAKIETGSGVDERILADALSELEKLRQKQLTWSRQNIWRITMKSPIVKLAAAAIIIVAVLIGIYLFGGSIGRTGVAWADVIRQMQQIRTATWTEVHEVFPPDDENVFVDDLGHVAQCAYKTPGRWRLDVTSKHIRGENKHIEESKKIQIWDFNAGKGLLLDPEKMTASPCSYEPELGKDSLFRTFLSPKADIPADAEPLGTKQVGGRETVGFRIRLKGDGTDFLMGDVSEIWVDAKTKRLVLAETRDAERRWVSTLKDFIFDQELDDSLFSLELPEGYKDIGPLQFMWVEPSEAK